MIQMLFVLLSKIQVVFGQGVISSTFSELCHQHVTIHHAVLAAQKLMSFLVDFRHLLVGWKQQRSFREVFSTGWSSKSIYIVNHQSTQPPLTYPFFPLVIWLLRGGTSFQPQLENFNLWSTNIAGRGIPVSIGYTSAIRVHFSASYVSLPERSQMDHLHQKDIFYLWTIGIMVVPLK